MLEIAIHGLGGQGVVTLSSLLAQTAFAAGWQAQAFPSFGPERTGSPVAAYVRLSRQPITTRSQIIKPDLIVILDDLPAMLSIAMQAGKILTAHKKPLIIINSSKTPQELKLNYKKLKIINASEALKNLPAKALNSYMLGVILRTTEIATLAQAQAAIKNIFTSKDAKLIAANLTALKLGYATNR